MIVVGTRLTGPEIYAAPAFSSSTFDTAPYLALDAGQSETIPIVNHLAPPPAIYIGSLDAYNVITFSGPGGWSLTYTGAELAGLTGAVADGNQQDGASNGLFTFYTAERATSVTFTTTADAFEIAYIAVFVPEPSTWLMMLGGFAGVGYVGYRRRKAASVPAV
jgi:hypothetical protein